jgi:hypothetical protein
MPTTPEHPTAAFVGVYDRPLLSSRRKLMLAIGIAATAAAAFSAYLFFF